MERKDVVILMDTRDGSYCAIPSDGITNGYLHDTYDNYGQQTGEYNAGDYTFGEENFDRELENFLRNSFEILADAVFYFNRNGIYDHEIDLTDEQVAEINDAITRFAEENETYTEATYFNYWDGSNYRSIILDSQLDFYPLFEIVDDEFADEIYADFENAVEIEDFNGIIRYEGKEFYHRVSRWQDNPFLFESEER